MEAKSKVSTSSIKTIKPTEKNIEESNLKRKATTSISKISKKIPTVESISEPKNTEPIIEIKIEPEVIEKQTLRDVITSMVETRKLNKKTLRSNDVVILKELIIELFNDIDVIEKLAKKELKTKKVVKRANTYSGITKPVAITEKMAEFADWKPTELHSRTDISSVILKYVRDNKLQNPEMKKTILPDQKLIDLLSYKKEKDGPLYYTTINRLIGRVIQPTVSQNTPAVETA